MHAVLEDDVSGLRSEGDSIGFAECDENFVGVGSHRVRDCGASTETTMRTLRILSGIAVLLVTLHFVHILHHFFVEAPHDSPIFWAGMVLAVVVWVLSFVGGCLLLKRSG
jgi:hypothetical protein